MRLGAGPPPLARPREPHATPPPPPPPCLPRTERSLASVACALHALRERPPGLRSLEHILMACFLHRTATRADPGWGLSTMQRILQRLAVSGPSLHEALGWRYGAAAPLWLAPGLHWRDGAQPALVAPVLAPLRDLGPLPVRRSRAATPWASTSVPRRRVLLIEGWDSEEEGSRRHWVGVTRDSTVRCHSRGDRSLTTLPDLHVATGAVLASPEGVCCVVCGVARPMVAPAAPAAPVPPRGGRRHRTGVARGPRARLRRKVQVAFHAP